ncbi:MAG: alpha/beta-hydrolase N-terminal domain-containing protein, partial [Corynebacterium variabile]
MASTKDAGSPEPSTEPRTETLTETLEEKLGRLTTYRLRLSYTGSVVATVLLLLSMTPSLLPRGPLFQGVVSAACAAVGYMIGVFASW